VPGKLSARERSPEIRNPNKIFFPQLLGAIWLFQSADCEEWGRMNAFKYFLLDHFLYNSSGYPNNFKIIT
jgi:hypothetical protein